MSKTGATSQRTEVSILVPAALLILVVLSSFTLFAYRSSVSLQLAERRDEAEVLARHVRSQIGAGRLPDASSLRTWAPVATQVMIVDERGKPVVADGESALATDPVTGEVLVSSDVSGRASFVRRGQTLTVQVDLPAKILRSRERSLKILTPLVMAVNIGVLLLVFAFQQLLLRPIEGMMQRLRSMKPESDGARDDIASLIETFEQALDTMAQPASDSEPLAALETSLAASIESGVLLCDPEGTMLALNEPGARILEISATVAGQPLSEFLSDHPELASMLDVAWREGQTLQRAECSIITSAGRRALGLTAHSLKRDDGEVRGYLVLFADLTEAQRKSAEQQLEASLNQIGELTAGVAHEMRNSLATLRGYLTLIERSPTPEDAGDFLHEIRRESDHLQRVLEDFLSFARPGSVRLQDVDLLRLVHRVAEDPALAGARVSIRSSSLEQGGKGHSESSVAGDPQLLERALRNLLKNAAEAQERSECRDPLELHLENASDEISMTVLDRGDGIPEELLDKVFDPFVSGRADGVGIGLALTRRIILLHNGQIALRRREGGGTVAEVRLPAGRIVTIGNNGAAVSESKKDAEING